MFIFVIRHSGFVKYKENASIKLVEKTIQEAQEIMLTALWVWNTLNLPGFQRKEPSILMMICRVKGNR